MEVSRAVNLGRDPGICLGGDGGGDKEAQGRGAGSLSSKRSLVKMAEGVLGPRPAQLRGRAWLSKGAVTARLPAESQSLGQC